jgi:hypothetical protein
MLAEFGLGKDKRVSRLNHFSSLGTLLCLWTGRAIHGALEHGSPKHGAFIFWGALFTYVLVTGNFFLSFFAAFLVASYFARKPSGRSDQGLLWGHFACQLSWGFFPFGLLWNFYPSQWWWVAYFANAAVLMLSRANTLALTAGKDAAPTSAARVVQLERQPVASERLVWGPVIATFNDGQVHAWVEIEGVRYGFDRISRNRVLVLANSERAFPPGVVYSSDVKDFHA